MSTHKPQVIDSNEFIDLLDYEFTGDSATVENKRRIVEGYRIKASIYHAAIYARVHRATVYRYYDSDPQFAQAMADSFEDAADVLESSTYEKALGLPDQDGCYRSGDSLLKMFWLKAHRFKFRDRMTVDFEQVDADIAAHLQRRQLPTTTTTTQFIDTTQSNGTYSTITANQVPVSLEQKENNSDSAGPLDHDST